MNKIVLNDGVHAPVIFCDLCERPIEDARSGVVVFPVVESPGQAENLVYAHQGPCGRLAEQNLRDLGRETGAIDLLSYLRYLVFNMGMTVEDVEAVDELIDPFGDLED